jgi:hypothetical protein
MTPLKMCDANITHWMQTRAQIAREVTIIEVGCLLGLQPIGPPLVPPLLP